MSARAAPSPPTVRVHTLHPAPPSLLASSPYRSTAHGPRSAVHIRRGEPPHAHPSWRGRSRSGRAPRHGRRHARPLGVRLRRAGVEVAEWRHARAGAHPAVLHPSRSTMSARGRCGPIGRLRSASLRPARLRHHHGVLVCVLRRHHRLLLGIRVVRGLVRLQSAPVSSALSRITHIVPAHLRHPRHAHHPRRRHPISTSITAKHARLALSRSGLLSPAKATHMLHLLPLQLFNLALALLLPVSNGASDALYSPRAASPSPDPSTSRQSPQPPYVPSHAAPPRPTSPH